MLTNWYLSNSWNSILKYFLLNWFFGMLQIFIYVNKLYKFCPRPNYGYIQAPSSPPPPTRSGHIYMKDAQSAEMNEEFIFYFWVMVDILYQKFTESSKSFDLNNQSKKLICFPPKRCAMLWNECRTEFQIFSIFSFWDMVDIVLKTTASSTLCG